MNTLVILFVIFSLVYLSSAAKRKSGKLTYEVNWSGGFKLCDGFEDSVIDLSTLKLEKASPTSTVLSGSFALVRPVMAGTSALIIIEKETPQGKVLAYTLELPDICEHVPAENMPWTLIVDSMKLDKRDCPLPALTYNMHKIHLNLSSANAMLNHENVGEYLAIVELQHQGDGLDVVEHTLTCCTFSFKLEEVRK